VFFAVLSTFLFSISVTCGHQSAKILGGTEANFWRLTCAALFLGMWSHVFGIGLGGRSFMLFLLSGIIGIGIGDMGLFQALPRLGSRLSMVIIQCLTPPFGALFEYLWLKTPLTTLQVLCGLLILAGVGIALSPARHLQITRKALATGIIAALIAASGGACGAVLSRSAYKQVHEAGESIPAANAAYQRILGGLFIAGICFLAVQLQRRRTAKSVGMQPGAPAGFRGLRMAWGWVLLNSLAGQTLGVSSMQRALETTPTGIVLAIISTTPVAVIPLASILEKEPITLRSVAGAVIAVVGVILLIWSR
jgi:drug/metabolite transporter (DMT)-like permease